MKKVIENGEVYIKMYVWEFIFRKISNIFLYLKFWLKYKMQKDKTKQQGFIDVVLGDRYPSRSEG